MVLFGALTWLAILLANPIAVEFIDYETITKVEYAYVLCFLIYIFNQKSNKIGISTMHVFCFYYTWIAVTDSFISYIPIWLCNLESLFAFSVLSYRLTNKEGIC